MGLVSESSGVGVHGVILVDISADKRCAEFLPEATEKEVMSHML